VNRTSPASAVRFTFQVREPRGCGWAACPRGGSGYSLPVFVGGRRRRVAIIAALAFAAGLSGCSGSSDSPTTLPPLSTTPAATQSTAPAANPKAEAVAVVKQYFRLLNNLDHDMNARAFEGITAPDCPCRAFARDIRKTAAKGQHYFGQVHLTSTTPVVDSSQQIEVLTAYNSTRGGTADNAGRVLFRGPRRRGVTELFFVRRVGGAWLIARINIIHKGNSS
jgi:hypothetical protein